MKTAFVILGITSLGLSMGWEKPKAPSTAKALREVPKIEVKNATLEISHEGRPPVAGKDLLFKGSFKFVDATPEMTHAAIAIHVVKMVNGRPIIFNSGGSLVKRSGEGSFPYEIAVPGHNLPPGRYEAQVRYLGQTVFVAPLVLK